MAVNYSTAAKNARLNAVAATIDAGSGPGVLQIGTTAMGTVLATIVLADPCAASASGGVLTFSGFPRSDTSADANGTAAAARIRDSDGNDVITGLTVGLVGSGADIIFESVSFNVGEIITLNSATITAN
jgi:hypothetical protein